MYFTDTWYSTQNFYRFNLSQNNKVDSIGTNHPKPYISVNECFAVDKENELIYLIGGYQYIDAENNGPLNTLQIFDVKQNKWTVGPTLKIARWNTACFYSNYYKLLYVFGGATSIVTNSIEYLNLSIPDPKWNMVGTMLTADTTSAYAFAAESYINGTANTMDTAFIIGGSSGICNVFSISLQYIQNCNKKQQTNLQGFAGVFIANGNNRFYTFGGRNANGNVTKAIEYAVIEYDTT
eukprot:76051_1